MVIKVEFTASLILILGSPHFIAVVINMMVRLHTSLLVVTLATGSALSSSNEYQRRSELDFNNHDQSRGLEQGPSRHLRFDHACAGVFGQNNLQSRGFVVGEDLFLEDLNLEKKVVKHKRAKGLRFGGFYEEFETSPGYGPGSGTFQPTSHFPLIGRDLDDLHHWI